MLTLLKCDAKELPPPPTEEELDRRSLSAPGSGPTLDNFRIEYLEEKIHHSVWNQDLWAIFMQKFEENWGHAYSATEDQTAISAWYWGHIKYLSYKYFMQTYSDPRGIAMAKSLSARNTRRRKVDNLYELPI
jgi:hypothetical protein